MRQKKTCYATEKNMTKNMLTCYTQKILIKGENENL